MKFVKSISLFFLYPAVMFGIGFWLGVESMHFFYPGEQSERVVQEVPVQESETEVQDYSKAEGAQNDFEEQISGSEPRGNETLNMGTNDLQNQYSVSQVASSMDTLCVDTEYVLEETDIDNGTVVETVWRLPDKYIGMNREQFLAAMENYELFPPLSEIERGFVNLEVLSFSREKVVVQMNYSYVQPSSSFYLAVRNNEVVVYLEDMETIYINTGIELTSLPEDMQQEVIQMIWIEDEESLYNFLENYSS